MVFENSVAAAGRADRKQLKCPAWCSVTTFTPTRSQEQKQETGRHQDLFLVVSDPVMHPVAPGLFTGYLLSACHVILLLFMQLSPSDFLSVCLDHFGVYCWKCILRLKALNISSITPSV